MGRECKRRPDSFRIFPVGVVRKHGKTTFVEIYEEYRDGLLGLDQFSHIIVFFWFHENDTPEKRAILKVHPRRDEANPLTGVFATRSPARPNLIGITTCKILSIKGNVISVEQIDAFDGTPVIDIKPCLSGTDLTTDLRVPEWAKGP